MALKKEDIYNFIKKAKNVLLEGKEEIFRSSQIGKILLEISSFNRDKNGLLKEVGQRLYKLDRSNLTLPKSFDAYFKQLTELEEKIAESEAKIADLKKQTPSKTDQTKKTDSE